MRKVLAALLTAAILASFCACQQDNPKTESSETMSIDDNGVVTKTLAVEKLDTHIEGVKVRDREVKEGTRMLINSENPLFLFRPSIPSYSTSSLLATYTSLPEDLRAFSALLQDVGSNTYPSREELIASYDKLLDQTDAENIPIFLTLERWNSINESRAYSYEELSGLLQRHPSLMGFATVEQCCNPYNQEVAERMKTIIKACKDNGAVFIWQDMEYVWEGENNYFQRVFEDKELYDLMTEYSNNIVITDKHNGQGRHFSTQSGAMGAWLSGVCGNWGSNVEAWLWWEIGNNDYEMSSIEHDGDNYFYRYPPAVGGIDLISDLVGGATVFSTEELYINYTTMTGIKFTETFWSVVYPLYQRIIAGAAPDKEEVKENVKVAYQFTTPNDICRGEVESDLFIDTYGVTRQWFTLFSGTSSSKKWIPYTGRYYIIPSLTKYANVSEVLPNADILNVDNYNELFGSSSKKQAYLNERYPETYTGDATLFSINGLTYIFNNCEFQQKVETTDYSLKASGLDLSTSLDLHTYMILEDNIDSVDIELVNLRLDTEAVCTGKEKSNSFINSYLKGGKMDREKDRRTTKIALTGFEEIPKVKVSGNNNPTAEVEFDPNTKTATITIVSNGKVTVNVSK